MRALLKSLIQLTRRTGLRWRGLPVPADGHIGRGVRSRAGWREGHAGRIDAGARLQLEDGVVLEAWGGSIQLGENVFIGPYTVIYGHGGVTIGDHTLISMHCRILSSNHTVPPVGTLIRSQPDVLRPTQIGRDVWLGAGVTVLGGVTIGDGCVVGAGAVVTHDLPAHTVALGVPARIVGQRDERPSPSGPA
jgi:acetyltransferase-like isoleucine patch superfamily enzyme